MNKLDKTKCVRWELPFLVECILFKIVRFTSIFNSMHTILFGKRISKRPELAIR